MNKGRRISLKALQRNRLLSSRKNKELNFLKNIKNGCSTLTVVNYFYQLEFNFTE